MDFTGSELLSIFFGKMHRGREYDTKEALLKANPDLLIFGASQCVGNYSSKIFEDSLRLETYNAGMGGQHIDYQVLVANIIIERKTPKIIIWDFDPKLFANDNSVFLKLGLNPYYHYNHNIKKALDRVDKYMLIKQCLFSYKYNSLIMQIINANLGNIDKRKGYTPFICRDLKESQVERKANYPDFGSDSERKFKLMNDCLSDWRGKGIKVYLVVSPIFKKDGYPINGVVKLKEICDQNKINYYDLSRLENIYDNPSYFRDEIHLCKNGSEIYSSYVANIIKNQH
jgi:hypothetical protein